MNDIQRAALKELCGRFDNVTFDEADFRPAWDLPAGYVDGWVGPIYVGCAPDGQISS